MGSGMTPSFLVHDLALIGLGEKECFHMLTRTMTTAAVLCLAGAMGFGCDETLATSPENPRETASIRSALGATPHDVTGFLYEIVCEDGFTYSEFVLLEDEMLPPWLDPNAGPEHYFSDLFTVLPEGECKVTATPMQDPQTPSVECHPVSAVFEVVAGQTTEIVLMAQCDGEGPGAGDIVGGLNDPPVITGLEFDPSKFIVECEELTLTAMASDPNGDAITYTWTMVTSPAGAVYWLAPVGPSASPSTTFQGQTPGYYEVTLTVTDTYGASTSLTFPIHVSDVPGVETCDQDQSHEWQADFSLDPNTECEDSKYLAVPSSGTNPTLPSLGANKIAVYDLATLLPLPTSPWDTCINPSRILMDGNTDVVVSCRGDGKINKHTRDGALLWSTQLPGCVGARGAVLNPQGRLFVACSSNGNVHELDPVNGVVLETLNFSSGAQGYYLYGLAADGEGVYLCAQGPSRVAKISVGSGLSVEWDVAQSCYGLATDAAGSVWVSGSALTRLSTADGSVQQTFPFVVGGNPAYGNGVMAGLGGNIYVGLGGYDQIVKHNVAAGTSVYLPLPAMDHHPRGVTMDTQGNVFTINLMSNTLTKFDPLGNTTTFGGWDLADPWGTPSALEYPYGYSGDMTGAITQCLTSVQDAWESSVYDSGNPATEWLTASWNASVPVGASITFSYSLDGGTWTQFATALDTNQSGSYTFAPALVGAEIQFKALLSAPAGSVNMPVLGDLSVTYQ